MLRDPRDRSPQALAHEWRTWVLDSLSGGADAAAVSEELAREGVPSELAEREVELLAAMLPQLSLRARRADAVLALLSAQAPTYIARRELCGLDEFYDRYFTAFRPVLFADGCSHMAAMEWSFASLRERFGDAVVEVGDAEPRSVRFDDCVDSMLADDADPNFYIMSRNRALAGSLAAMAAELSPVPEFIHPVLGPETANLWLGPRGTHTPLHHDTTHVYFCQFEGRKRYRLVPPWERAILDGAISERGDAGVIYGDLGAHALSVELMPGESLFIPAGWWHEVRSLEPSISVSFRAYQWPADYDWYRPGAIR